MRVVIGLIAIVLVGVLASCSRQEPAAADGDAGSSAPAAPASPEAVPTAPGGATPATFVPSDAALAKFEREGPEPTLRRIAVADYWLHYKLMQATGIEAALGGEAQAVRALQALGDAYERRVRGASEEIPRMIRTDFTGEGMGSGLAGMSMGSFSSMVTGGLFSDVSNEQFAELVKNGPIKQGNDHGSFEIRFGEDGSVSQSSEFEINEGGINGKVRMKTRVAGCPDEDGKVTVEIDVDSQMTVHTRDGTGGHVKSQLKYERWLDDDAQLMSPGEGSAANLRLSMGGLENFRQQSFDVTVSQERGSQRIVQEHSEQGFSIFRPKEIERTGKLIHAVTELQGLIAEFMLRGLGRDPPWESGRCIDLKVASQPGKRTGLDPRATFELEALPRARSDGKPAGGTVTATLAGGAQLDPAGGKVRADARYQYSGPEKKNETASIAFESRSRRGVGRATLNFDTKRPTAYRIEGGADEFHGTGIACDLGKQFFVEGSGVTVRFEPRSIADGRYSYSGTMSGFRVYGHGTYGMRFDGTEPVLLLATGPGSVVTSAGTHTREGSEKYTLTPVESANCDE